MPSIVPRQPTNVSNRNDDQYAQIAGKYVHAKSSSYYLELGPNGNYVLFEGSQIIGTYEVNGAEITLFVAQRPTSKARIEDGSIIDEQGDRWTRANAPPLTRQPEKTPEPASGTDITETLPTADSVLELEPEALGGFLLESLSAGNSQDLRQDNFMSRMRAHYKQDAVNSALLEAWAWLVREGLLIGTKGERILFHGVAEGSRAVKTSRRIESQTAFRRNHFIPLSLIAYGPTLSAANTKPLCFRLSKRLKLQCERQVAFRQRI